MRILVAVVLLASTACVPDPGPTMAAGQDCLECHGGGEGEDDAKAWTVAGTWARGAHIEVVDASGKTVPMRGNKVGNFYTAERLTPPLHVTVEGVAMPANALTSGSLAYGGCNLCHSPGGAALADLGLMAAGRDCLLCHDDIRARRFYAAGTFPPAGRTVVITDNNNLSVTKTTNAAGNFWVVEPLRLPLKSATVNGESMPPQKGLAPNCNACHGANGKADD
jgi:hypothetical protein